MSATDKDLKPYASAGCYGCKGTGRIIGFGNMNGRQCLCVLQCYVCDELVLKEKVECDDPMPKQFCSDTCLEEYRVDSLMRKSNG